MSLNTTPATWVAGTVVTAAQLNTEIRDALTGIQAAWTSYSPAWAGSVTNPAIGNGTIAGNYIQIGKTIKVRVVITAGSTTTFGSGAYTISLPVGAVGGSLAPRLFCIYLIGTNQYHGSTYGGASTPNLSVDNGTAGGVLQAVTPTVPGTFASASTLTMTGEYEAA